MTNRQISSADKTVLETILQNATQLINEDLFGLEILVNTLTVDSRLAILQCLSPEKYQLAEVGTIHKDNLTATIIDLLKQSETFSFRIRALLETNVSSTVTSANAPIIFKQNPQYSENTEKSIKEIALAISDMDEPRLKSFIQELSKPECINILLLSSISKDSNFSSIQLDTLHLNVELMLGRNKLSILQFKNLLRQAAHLPLLTLQVAQAKPTVNSYQNRLPTTNQGTDDIWGHRAM